MYDFLVVGAGLAGSTIAERLASQLEANVLVIDKRPHLAGNTYDPLDASGLRYHAYGPHVFHTNARHVVDYLSAFTDWIPYEHRVLARVDGKLFPIPINRTTINQLSRKQCGLDPSELDASVCGRIPTRSGDDDRYFTDSFQAMPADGFTAMVEKMLAYPRIDVATGCDFASIAGCERFNHVVYTGPIDEYFEYKFGTLPYRSLRFEFEVRDVAWVQPVGCVNEPSADVPYTRAEYKYYNMDQVVASALLTFEDLACTAAVAS